MNVSLSTTYKMKNGFLLIETFRKTKLWPLGSSPCGLLLFVSVSKNLGFMSI
jgi:hypothetical protein